MRSQTLILTGNSTDFTTNLSPQIRLDPSKKYEAALLSINLYNTIPNITDKNNRFEYSPDNGSTWKGFQLNIGAYEVSGINDEIQRQMIANGDYDSTNGEFYITVTVSVPESKSVIIISNPTYRVDFTAKNLLGPTLGFRPVIIGKGYNKSQDIVDINRVNSVLVNIDIISGSYVNSNQSPAIYSFDPNVVSPGYKINKHQNPLTFYHVNTLNINSIRVWLTDQNNDPIDLRGERVTVRIQIREEKNIKQLIKEAIKELKSENVLN